LRLPGFAAMALCGLAMAMVMPTLAHAADNPVTFQPLNVRGDEPSYLEMDIGAFNIQGNSDRDAATVGEAEFRYGRKWFFVGPAVGLLANTQGAVYGYVGLYSDIVLGNRIVITPLAGLGGYDRGSSLDLGGTFAFRLSATIAYQFDNQSRLGFKFGHIENAGLYDRNPGETELLVSYSLPLR
jgi:hypothetical protein